MGRIQPVSLSQEPIPGNEMNKATTKKLPPPPPPSPRTTLASSVRQPMAKKKKQPRVAKISKKAPGAPRRFKTAFIFFSIAKHREIREELEKREAPKQSTTAIAKMVGREWKNLPSEERAIWDKIAAKDKARYEIEKRAYKGPWHVPIEGERDPAAPRRPCSAFVNFLHTKRHDVKRANPEASSSEIMRIVTNKWHDSPERAQYLEAEARELAKYKKEMKEWRSKQKRKPEAMLAKRREALAWKALETPEEEDFRQQRDTRSQNTSTTTTREEVLARVQDSATPSSGEASAVVFHSSTNSMPRPPPGEDESEPPKEGHLPNFSGIIVHGRGGPCGRQRDDYTVTNSWDRDPILSNQPAPDPSLAQREARQSPPEFSLLGARQLRHVPALHRDELVRGNILLGRAQEHTTAAGRTLADPPPSVGLSTLELALLLRQKREEHEILRNLVEMQLASRLGLQAGLGGSVSSSALL